MQTATDNLMQIAAELNAAGKQVKVTVLKPRKARRSELIMSSTKGVRTNTNRRGQAYTGHATYATQSTVCLLYTSPSPRDLSTSRMPSSA